MKKQLIITMNRESGSGGLEIAQKLGERLGLKVYDKNIFEEIGERFDIDASRLEKFDETPRMLGITRNVNEHSSSPAVQVVKMQREFLRSKAEEGKSFVVLGRCGMEGLRDWPCLLIRLFIEADEAFKVERTMAGFGYTENQAKRYMAWEDRRRESFHDQFCRFKWRDRTSYDLIVKSDKLGIEKTLDLLETYVRMRIECYEET